MATATVSSFSPAEQLARKRKMLTVLPLLLLPFVIGIFYGLDGGKGSQASTAPVAGLNLDLPKAEASTITTNKLEATSTANDSTQNRDLVFGSKVDSSHATAGKAAGVDMAAGTGGTSAPDALALAKQQLASAQNAQSSPGTAPATATLTVEQQLAIQNAQHQREMEALRAQMEMQRLTAQGNSAGGGGGGGGLPATRPVAAVKKVPATRAIRVDDDAVVSSLGRKPRKASAAPSASFRGFDSSGDDGVDANTLPAVIHESQEVVSGSLVKLRLTEPAVVNGHQLAANTFIYGKCALSGERLIINIESLKSKGSIFPASLEVYDVDGLQGLNIPGTISRDASKQAGADAMGAGDMMTMSSSAATAAAGVAVNAVRSIGQKKIRLVKVRLKAGYQVMLKVDKER